MTIQKHLESIIGALDALSSQVSGSVSKAKLAEAIEQGMHNAYTQYWSAKVEILNCIVAILKANGVEVIEDENI